MKKIAFSTVAFLLFISMTTCAQFENFDLSTYKLPDLKRHQLDLNVNGSGTLRSNNNQINPSEQNYFSGSGNVNPVYSFYRNSKKYQGNQNASYLFRYGNYNYENSSGDLSTQLNESKSDNVEYLSEFSIMSQNRFYLKKLLFIEANLDAELDYKNSSRKEKNYINNALNQMEDSDYRGTLYSFNLPLYVGYGRIEQIQDARHTLYILEDLYKHGRLDRIPGNDEILAITEKISQVKNKRFFDSRLQKIDELDTVDTQLNKYGLIKEADIVYFSSMNDMWNYGGIPIRHAGYRFYFGITPMTDLFSDKREQEGIFDDSSYLSETKNEDHSYRLLFSIGFIYSKPIKQKWQFDMFTNVGIGPGKFVQDYTSGEYVNSVAVTPMNYVTNLGADIGFFPNTRTDITLEFKGQTNHLNGDATINGIDDDSKSFSYDLVTDLSINYYISPRLRLGIEGYLDFNFVDAKNGIVPEYPSNPFYYSNYLNRGWYLASETKEKNLMTGFNLSFKYSIF